MLDDELLRKIVRGALSNGGEYADVFVEHKRITSIQLEDDRIEKVVTGAVSGIGVRLIYGTKTAYAYSNDFSEASLLELASTISTAAARELPPGSAKEITLDLKKGVPGAAFPIKVPAAAVPMSSKIALVKKGNEFARKASRRIKQVSVVCRDSLQKVKIFTSENYSAEDERMYTTGMVRAVAADDGVIQTGIENAGGVVGYELFEEISMEELARRAAGRALMMLEARRAPGGRMPVIISSEAGGTIIHEAIGHGLEADLVQHGLSVYAQKLGRQVASPVITVVDDATLPNKRGSFGFDDEGTPSRRNVLVKNGMLVGYLYDKYTAMSGGVSSTGNGRRESYEHKPIPRMTNTLIEPGTLTPEEVIRSVSDGLLVKKMGGGQVNTVTGDFVFEVQEGYVIQNGDIGEPVRGATLIGNGLEILKAIDMVASDLGFSIGTCGKDGQGVPVSDAVPTLRIPEIVVGGEVSS